MFRHAFRCFLLITTFSSTSAFGQDSLSFQGYLTDGVGEPLDTMVAMTFKLYKGGSPVWTEVQPTVNVSGGVFNVMLGSVTPMDTVAFNRPIELGITPGNNAEISPRTPLAAAGYARALPAFYTYNALNGDDEAPNVVGGYQGNSVGAGVVGATISGGGGERESFPVTNSIGGNWGTVGGGYGNAADGLRSVIAGGLDNIASGLNSTVGGGGGNQASASSTTVGGGNDNSAGGSSATVAGGEHNASSGVATTVGGGSENLASYFYSTVPGGKGNVATGYVSFAAGHYAKAIHDGTFVWDDRSISNSSDSLVSTAPNQFLVGALGGVGINTNAPAHPLQVGVGGDTLGNGAHLTDGGTWTNGSSENFKEDFQFVSSLEVLTKLAGLDIQSWRYRGSREGRHMGPTAEDFASAFSMGSDDRYISTVDADGVAMSAIQGLYTLIQQQQDEIRLQQERISRLEIELRSLR